MGFTRLSKLANSEIEILLVPRLPPPSLPKRRRGNQESLTETRKKRVEFVQQRKKGIFFKIQKRHYYHNLYTNKGLNSTVVDR